MKFKILLVIFLSLSSLSIFATATQVNNIFPPRVYIPNAFSPNDDGINDIFKVETGDVILEKFQLKVFNRWGTLLFETDDYLSGWNGRYNNERMPAGTFTYYIKYEDKDGLVFQFSGTINLLY